VVDDDHVQGDRDAPVMLVEYADFQCPRYAAANPVLRELLHLWPGVVSLVCRHAPR
jgi:protein-disulfide isomerase